MKSIDRIEGAKLENTSNSFRTINNFYNLKTFGADVLSASDAMHCEFSQKILTIKC